MFQTTNQKNIIFNRKKGLGGLGNWDITMWLGAKQHETWCAVGCVSVNNNNNINNTSCAAVAAAATCSNMQQHAATCSNMQQHAATCSNSNSNSNNSNMSSILDDCKTISNLLRIFSFQGSALQSTWDLRNRRGSRFFFVFNVFP